MIRLPIPSLADELDLVDPRIAVLHPIVAGRMGAGSVARSDSPRAIYNRNLRAQRRARDRYHRLNGRPRSYD